MIKQGDIYLVDFGVKYNSELGKIRPAVVMQNNFFNRALKSKNIYKQVLLVPLSTVEIEDDFRIKISKRDKLKQDSYIIANWICTLDYEHLLLNKGLIAKLNEDEITNLKSKICNLM